MKIAVATRAIAPLHGRGGLERAVADICGALAARGHDVTVFTRTRATHDAAPSPYAVVEMPWEVTPFVRSGSVPDRALHYPPFVGALTDALRARGESYAVGIGHGAAAAAFVPLRATGQVARLIVNPHGMEEFDGACAKRLLLRRQQSLVRVAAAGADAVIATDNNLVAPVRRYLAVPQAKVVVVPNGVNIAAIDALTPQDAAPVAPPMIVSIGRIESSKGLEVLAAALGRIKEQLPAGWQWVHIGDGAARDHLKKAITRAGIGAHTALPGTLPDADLHRALAEATVFVHPTRYEGSSLATLEAMAHGLPVVASAVGGIPDKIIPGETGWLTPPNDPQALAAALLEALHESPVTLRTMGARGRALVEARFSLDAAVDRLIAVMEDVRR